MGSAGPECIAPAVHLHQTGRKHLGGSTDQRAQGRRMVDEEKGWQIRRGKRSQGRQRPVFQCSQVRVKKPRWLCWTPSSRRKIYEQGKEEELVSKGATTFLEGLQDDFLNSDLPVARYVCSTLGATPPSNLLQQNAELFPCPPPYSWDRKTMPTKRSRRGAKRDAFRRAICLWTNYMCCALSQQALNVEIAPERGRAGVPLSSDQWDMVKFLRSLAVSVVRHGSDGSSCGLRMPATADRLSRLRLQLDVFAQLPYSRQERKFEARLRDSSFAATQALPVIAERLSLPTEVSDFDPMPYLSRKFQRIFEDPNVILKPPEELPAPIHVKGTATRSELLKVFSLWDGLGRLFVCRSDEVSVEDRCELFAVAKDADKDRQILHRKRRNLREYHVAGASRDLPHGVLLTQLPLEDRFVCVCSVDDVKDFYHAYSASEARARSSPVGPVFRWGEVAHLQAAQVALAEERLGKDDKLVCCFRGLGMGDHAAVDIAQESHVNLLRAFGGMKELETLSYRKPLPLTQTGFYEGVMIDDHLGIQLLPVLPSEKATLEQVGRDQEAFVTAEEAYGCGGLKAHPKKRVRRSSHTKVWGAEVEGFEKLVGPVRSRLLQLARLSAEASERGPMDQKVLEALTGLWAFNAQFRRPLFAFLHSVYHEQSPGGPGEPFRLSRSSRNELLIMALLAPLCINDLSVLPDPHLYCVDASPSGAGICRSFVGKDVSRELWRRCDKQGYRIPLLTKLQSCLKGTGWDEDFLVDDISGDEGDDELPPVESFEREGFSTWGDSLLEQFANKEIQKGCRPPLVLWEHPFDLLELYSGCGVMSSEWKKKGFHVAPPLELKDGWNLERGDLFWGLVSLIRAKKVRFLWWAPPCTSFSLARTPKLRNLENAFGFNLLDEATLKGNLHAMQSLFLAMLQVIVGMWMGGEQPAFGFMRGLAVWKFLLSFSGVFEILFDWCRYGRDFRKTTRIMTNCSVLKGLAKRRCHSRKHVVLKGTATTLAGAYTPCFCNKVAELWGIFWEERSSEEKGFVDGEDCQTPLLGVFGDYPKQPKKSKGGSALWAVQLSEGLVWSPWLQYKFKVVSHINLQETKARRSLFKRLKRDQRVVVAQDSRVNLGALGKGRSPSNALNSLMKTEAPFLLGKNLYVATMHFPTWSIRADGPSRQRRVDPPRTALPSWFWRLRSGDCSAGECLDDLEGLPRAYNRWFLLVGMVLLRESSRSPKTTSDSGAQSRLDCAWSSDRTYSIHPTRPFGTAGGLASSSSSRRELGMLGSASHRSFVRTLRRIYDSYVRHRAQSTISCGDHQCGDPTVWLGEILSCSALGRTAYMGKPGTSDSSSSNSKTSAACLCGYCSILEVGALCSPTAFGILCFIETIRAYHVTQTRFVPARGPPRSGGPLHSDWVTQNPQSSSSKSTRTNGRSRCCYVGDTDPVLGSDVESYLGGLIGFFQTSI